MAATDSGSSVADSGGARDLSPSLGTRRLKAMLMLSQHPELDDIDWSGKVEIHFGGRSVKGNVQPALRELAGY